MQLNLDGDNCLDEKIKTSIARLKEHEPDKGYILGFSGGKDSITCKALCDMAGVKYEAHYSFTTIDPPEVVQFIRKHYPDVIFDKPVFKGEPTSFYKLVAVKGLPTRLVRWCCDKLKEVSGNKGDTLILGVRWEESPKRSNREIFYSYKGKDILNPIIDWSSQDVWSFIKQNNIPYPSLYDNGHKRLGCILCPLACKAARVRDYNEYPNHVRAIEKSLDKFLAYKPESTLYKWGNNSHEIVYYWVHGGPVESAKGACMQHIKLEENTENEN